MSVALHLQRAFAVRDVTVASPFRPPAVPFVANPYGVSRGADPTGSAGASAFSGAPHRVVSLQASAAPFTPAAQRARPPPIDAPAQHQQDPVAATTVVSQTTTAAVPPPTTKVDNLKAIATTNGLIAYSPEAMREAQWSPANYCSDRIKAYVASIAPLCPSWSAASLSLSADDFVSAAADDGTRGGLFGGKSGKVRPERQLHHKVMSVLSRVTPEKYEALKVELLELPVRQADDEQLRNIVDVFFNKAVHEEKFCPLYAGMVQSLFHAANEEAAAANAATHAVSSPTTPNNAERTSALARKLRAALLNRCQHEFERPFQLTQADLSEDGVPLSAEEIEEKHHALKQRLCGNIRFVGELFLHNLVSERIIQNIVSRILTNVKTNQQVDTGSVTSSDDCMEAFATLLRVVGSKASEKIGDTVKAWVQVAEEQCKNPKSKLSQRVRFLLMNVVDYANSGWGAVECKAAAAKKKKKNDAPSVGSPTSGSSSSSSIATPLSTGKKATMPAKTGTSSSSFGAFDGLSSPNTPIESPQKAKAKAKASSAVVAEGAETSASASASASGSSRHRKFNPSADKTLVELVAAYPEVDTLVHALGELDLSVTDSLAAAEHRDRAVSNFFLTAARTRKLESLRSAAARVAVQLVTCTTIIETKAAKAKTEVGRPFYDETQLSELLNDIIVGSIMDGVLEDAPHYYANWLEMVNCSTAAGQEAQQDDGCACNPGVVVHALIRGTAEACNEGIIDNEKQAIRSLAAALSARATCRAAALEFLEAPGEALPTAFADGLRAAL